MLHDDVRQRLARAAAAALGGVDRIRLAWAQVALSGAVRGRGMGCSQRERTVRARWAGRERWGVRGGHRPTWGAPQPSGSPWRVHFWHLPLADPQFIVIAQMGTNVGWPGTTSTPVYVGNSTMQTIQL